MNIWVSASKRAAHPALTCIGASAMVLVGCVGASGSAVADPTPSTTPTTSAQPSPSPSPSASTTPATSAQPSASLSPSASAAASPSSTPPPAPRNVIDHDGLYQVGIDIVPGVYGSAGPVGTGTCYWKRLGNPDGALIDNALTKKPQVVEIEATDKAFKTDGCQPWHLTDETPPPSDAPAASGLLQSQLGVLNGLLAPHGMQVPGN